MPDLLLEFFSEEIPARMQARAAEDLRKGVTDRLAAAGLPYEGAKAFATPRRLALTVQGVPARQPDLKEERKGPKLGAPEQAIAGFLRAAGLTSIDQAKVQADKKGDFYVAITEKPGRLAIDVIAEIVPEVVKTFPWPKSMRWGAASAKPGALAWVRPLHSIIATFGPETEEPEIVPFVIDGVSVGDVTHGHRFLAPAAIKVKRFDDYMAKLHHAKVVVDPARRAEIIKTDAKNLAFAQGFELVEDDVLLAEVAGLVEWPVVLMGSFDESFLAIPAEVIRATIRNNQKCFVVRDPKAERLANKFILTANIEANDGGAAIVAGNERVIRARLSDAKFFYETDLKTKLEDRLPKFEQIVFHEKLGTQAERIARIERLAAEIAPLVGADVEKAKRAARLCKADLLTEVVGEFPEVQGLMGKYYALAQGEDASVAAACEEHYKPVGPGDRVPSDPVSIAVALADKIDTLVGFWAIDEKPTGSKDPYALRRAALGVTRIILELGIRISLSELLKVSFVSLLSQFGDRFNLFQNDGEGDDFSQVVATGISDYSAFDNGKRYLVLFGPPRNPYEGADEIFSIGSEAGDGFEAPIFVPTGNQVVGGLLSFFIDRLKVQLREQGARHDLVDAVLALGATPASPAPRVSGGEGSGVGGVSTTSAAEAAPHPRSLPTASGGREAQAATPVPQTEAVQDDLLLIVRRVEALGKFLDTDDGKNLLAGTKRAANILRIEEKKDGKPYTESPDPARYELAEERELAAAIGVAKADADRAVKTEDFAAAMTAMAKLRPHVDAFFDKVTVNAPDPDVRENRLKLLNEIRQATRAVADFSKIEG